MTPERIAALLVSLSPILLMAGGAFVYLMNRRDAKRKEKHPLLDLTGAAPTTGITIDDDHADDAIAAWRDRALAAEKRVDRLEVDNQRLRDGPPPPT